MLHADPLSDTFQPDVFRTEPALKARTPGLTDPEGKVCPARTASLTFAEAVDTALCRNPATRSAWAAAKEQAAALGVAQSAWLPNISATASETRNFGEHVDVTGVFEPNTQNTRDAALTLSWTLYDFGARDGRITSARHLLDAAAATVNSVTQQTVLNVVQAFYGAVAADADLAAAKTTETDDQRALEVARALSQGGAGSLADVLQVETAYDQAVLARIQAEANAQTARGTLATTLGLPASQPFTLDSPAVPDQVPALTAKIADLMDEASRQRPDLLAAKAQLDASEANIRVARAAGRPSISVSAGREYADTPGVPHENTSLLSLNVTVPIFTGFNVGYSVRQAQGAYLASEANVQSVELTVSQSVWSSYYALDSADRSISVTSGLVKTAEQNEQVALGRYQAGFSTIVDVLTAQAAASLARQTRIATELAWQTSRAQLAFALGRLSGAAPLANGNTP
jgi:TolC family type I secretion outer membrane protein